ncbi:MAG: Bug family tripartite tricarboxylate transporter substrate binding protein [Betaproteobacteria bacterium]
MFRLLAVALFAALAMPVAAQQGTITLVVGFPAGATSDILTRIVAEEMRAKLGQPVIVENKAGAGGRIANEAVKAAKPDGTTLLMTPVATMSIYPHSFGNLRYDPFKDFRPIAHLSDFQLGLGVSAQVPAKTLKEYVALVKKDPRKYGNYASAAVGSIPHFLGVLFARTAGIEMTHVPYKGTAHVLQALASGEISAATTVNADINRLVAAGKARLLAVGGAKRDPAFPDVPTFKEAGYDMPAATPSWYALFATAGTPDAAAERLSEAAIAAIKDPAVNKRLTDMGLQPTGYGPAELARIMRKDYENWGPVIKASGFKPGN